MNQLAYIISLCVLLPLLSRGQDYIVSENDTINRVDTKGQRQGKWVFRDDKAVMILMHFENDKPKDTILYYENNLLRLVYIKTKTDTTFYTYYGDNYQCNNFVTKVPLNYCDENTHINNDISRFFLYEIFPVYYGGEEAMTEYLEKQVKAFPSNETGKVKVLFTLDKTGKPSGVKIKESGNEKLNEYCIKAIENMPRWQAGFQGGAVVTVPMILPITCN